MKIKFFMIICVLLMSFSVFSSVALNLDFQDFSQKRPVQVKGNLKVDFDKAATFTLPNSQEEVEIIVTQNLPSTIKKMNSKSNAVVINLKLYDVSQSKKRLVNSGRILTSWGKTASMKKFKDKEMKQPLTTLRIIPIKM